MKNHKLANLNGDKIDHTYKPSVHTCSTSWSLYESVHLSVIQHLASGVVASNTNELAYFVGD